jgi:hypothetical protein
MLIRRDDLDPQVYEAMMTGITASYAKPNPSAAERRIQQEERRLYQPDGRLWKPWNVAALALGTAASAAMLVETGATATVMALLILPLPLIVAGVAVLVRANRNLNVVHPDLLAGWLPHLELGRAERAYCETLALLAKPGLHVSEQTGREVLAELNRLMALSRRLDEQRSELQAGATDVERIEAERADVAGQLAGATDPAARANLERSLALCETRLQNAQALRPAVQQLDAQRELIAQTLAAIQSTLTRQESAHRALTAPDVDEIQRRLAEINSEARAVESAVQEVISLGRR